MSEKHTTDEFAGNVKVTISENEVRVWVCDEKGCQFRFKAMGKVVKSGGMDVMVVAKNNCHDALLDALKAWQKYDSEMADKHPCPDYTLRTAYRNEARRLTEAAQAEKEG